MILHSVEDFFKKRENVEKYNEDKIEKLEWKCPDVLFSFRGIYAIGVFIYYRERFVDDVKTDIIVKNENSSVRQLLYSDKYLIQHYSEFSSVNNLPEMIKFLEHYYDIGNIIPTWPGANVNRGMAHCYDIPNIYYRRHEKFVRLISGNIYKYMYIDKILEDDTYDTVKKMLEMGKSEYVEFLKYIVHVIEERTHLLKICLQEEKGHE